MAPSKFENHIKKSLQEREIRPSANAWNSISGKLEVSEKPRSKSYYWYGIAASAIGLLLVSAWYFNGEKMIDIPQTVVEENREGPALQEKQQVPKVVLGKKITIENTNIEKIIEPKNTNRVVALPEIESAVKKAIAVVAKPSIPQEKVVIVPRASNGLIDSKIAEIAAQVGTLEKKNGVVTDEEIDALLLEAQQEILENKIFRKDSSVDPMALLADVENELDKSFRDEIFDALKNGLLKVRTAVADRNK
ncbi:hypothetical protein [uncultured Kriegella sp.]|uniref:hypothetical protein n=1 Tax=uncultured Kriegella sp. TaxID=1798910 RepID=UPI0030DB9CB2|tara:strand:- start:129755 stop:130501 length:747 start_codon:yes stop_codon:yes gene_type:complete